MNKVTINIERCKACGLCIDVCPRKLLEFDGETMNSRGLNPVKITDQPKCTACALCAVMCPDAVIKVEKEV